MAISRILGGLTAVVTVFVVAGSSSASSPSLAKMANAYVGERSTAGSYGGALDSPDDLDCLSPKRLLLSLTLNADGVGAPTPEQAILEIATPGYLFSALSEGTIIPHDVEAGTYQVQFDAKVKASVSVIQLPKGGWGVVGLSLCHEIVR